MRSEVARHIPPTGFETIHLALRNASKQPPRDFEVPTSVLKREKLVLFNIAPHEFSAGLVSLFRRDENWLLQGGFVSAAGGERGFVVEVYRKDALSATAPDGVVYHVTDAASSEAILRGGLKSGRTVGKHPRSKRFQECSYYLYASPTLADAATWAKTLSLLPTEWRFLRIDVGAARISVLRDPCSGELPALILDAEVVPPSFITEVGLETAGHEQTPDS
ncbi:hypothetical protein J0H58_13165 [bacterium]|nr:hypothetical protein [bacterium]